MVFALALHAGDVNHRSSPASAADSPEMESPEMDLIALLLFLALAAVAFAWLALTDRV